VHLGFLVGVRNRISVTLDWFWAYLTYRSGTRLITGGNGSQKREQMYTASELQRQSAA
jgi:NADH dehydrogenase/putative oxidoreductase